MNGASQKNALCQPPPPFFNLSAATHLSDQRYDLCFRREEGKCAICFTTSIVGEPGDVDTQTSYGIGSGLARLPNTNGHHSLHPTNIDEVYGWRLTQVSITTDHDQTQYLSDIGRVCSLSLSLFFLGGGEGVNHTPAPPDIFQTKLTRYSSLTRCNEFAVPSVWLGTTAFPFFFSLSQSEQRGGLGDLALRIFLLFGLCGGETQSGGRGRGG